MRFVLSSPLKLNSYSSAGGSDPARLPPWVSVCFVPCASPHKLCALSFQASSPAYSGSNLYSPDSSANSGPIISDVTELAQSSPSASPSGSLDER